LRSAREIRLAICLTYETEQAAAAATTASATVRSVFVIFAHAELTARTHRSGKQWIIVQSTFIQRFAAVR